MSVSELNDKDALLVVALLGYLANHAVTELQRNIARIEDHISSVDSVAQASKNQLIEIRAYLRQRKILPP